MATPSGTFLLDTNILLRLSDRLVSDFQVVRSALVFLKSNHSRLYYTSQNLMEFWNVATRPLQHNGLGLSIAEADQEARGIEAAFKFLPDNAAVHYEWKRLVLRYGVSGSQVHDTHLVASMNVHGVSHLLTLNIRDFTRYSEINVFHPSQIAA